MLLLFQDIIVEKDASANSKSSEAVAPLIVNSPCFCSVNLVAIHRLPCTWVSLYDHVLCRIAIHWLTLASRPKPSSGHVRRTWQQKCGNETDNYLATEVSCQWYYIITQDANEMQTVPPRTTSSSVAQFVSIVHFSSTVSPKKNHFLSDTFTFVTGPRKEWTTLKFLPQSLAECKLSCNQWSNNAFTLRAFFQCNLLN